MKALQSFIIYILQPCMGIKIGKRIRDKGITACCTLLSLYFIIFFTQALKPIMRASYTANHVVCAIILAVLIILSADRPLKPIKWNPLLFYSSFITGLLMIIVSLLHPIGEGYGVYSFMLIFLFPCLYLVWNNRGDYDYLFKKIVAATSITGLLYYAYCWWLATKGLLHITPEGRVNGSLYDPNMFSMIGMVMAVSATYMFFINKRDKVWLGVAALSFGAGSSMVVLGGSRVSILVVIGAVFSAALYFKKTWINAVGEIGIRAHILRLAVFVSVFIIFAHIGQELPNLQIRSEAKKNEQIVIESNVDEEKSETKKNDEPEADIEGLKRLMPKGKDINSYTSGRYNIWKSYAQFFNMTGNNIEQADWEKLTMNTVKHAHNNFVEMTYRCGIPVGLLHTFTNLVAVLICTILLFDKKYREPHYLFCIIFTIMYTIEGLFDIATIPFERHAPFYFYIAMAPMMSMSKKKA